MSDIDAVLFDLGKVLVHWDPFLPYVGRYERAEVEEFFAEIDFPAFNHRQDEGRSWAQARRALAASHPHLVEMLDPYVEDFAAAVPHEVPGATELVEDLRAAGLRVLGLTNWPAETFPVAGRQAPVVTLLEDVLVSGEVGVAKPDPRIFELAVQRFGLVPARTVFTDDKLENVEAARACGLRALPFTEPRALRAGLRDLGVPVPA